MEIVATHVVYELAISREHGFTNYYAIAAHEMAHIRSFAVRLYDLAHKESAKAQPCDYPDSETAIAAGEALAEEGISSIRDAEYYHKQSDPRFSTPKARASGIWSGATPEDAYGK